MKERVISGVVIAIAAIVFGWIGGWPLAVVLAPCSLIGCYEMMRALQVHGHYEAPDGGVNTTDGMDRKLILPEVVALVAAAIYWAILVYQSWVNCGFKDMTLAGNAAGNAGVLAYVSHADMLLAIMIVGVFLVEMSIYVLTFPRYETHQIVGAIYAFLYVPVLISFIYRARFAPSGKFVYALIFLCSWICDTGAWFFGRLFGRHKMAPILSPKKTIEGAAGGVLCSALACWGAARLAAVLDPGSAYDVEFIIIGVCGSFLGMIGDLAASAIKRNHNVKDYGNIIPGHGGIMDRFDSIIFTAPVIYFLSVLLLVW